MKKVFFILLVASIFGEGYQALAQEACEAMKTKVEGECSMKATASGMDPAVAYATCSQLINEAIDESPMHEPFFHWYTFDVGGGISRGIQVLIKSFLSDDSKVVAELVYDGDGEGGGAGSGGCGGTYTGDNGSCDDQLVLKAVASPLTDIPAETAAYPADIKVQDTSIGKLADLRTKEVMKGRASIDEQSSDNWAIEYRAQQRAIQALTDALVMKKAYTELAAIADNVSTGSFTNYSTAASTVATRRLMLDALMALRKRVIAARVRARAETMEANIDTQAIPTPATIDESNLAPSSSTGGTAGQSQTVVSGKDDKVSEKIDDYGLGDQGASNTDEESKDDQDGESETKDNSNNGEG